MSEITRDAVANASAKLTYLEPFDRFFRYMALEDTITEDWSGDTESPYGAFATYEIPADPGFHASQSAKGLWHEYKTALTRFGHSVGDPDVPPAGWYITATSSAGVIFVWTGTEADIKAAYKALDDAYGEWLDSDDEQ